MKYLLLMCLGLGINLSLAAQTDWKALIQQDNVRNFVGHLHQSGNTLNDCVDIDGVSYHLLSYAIMIESKDILYQLLFDENIDLSKTCSDKTILMYAVEYGNLELVKALVNEGVDIHQKISTGKSALDLAKQYEQDLIYGYLNSQQ